MTVGRDASPSLPPPEATAARRQSARTLGLAAMGVAVLTFSLGSTLVKKAGIPGPALAFWRMVLTSMSWGLILWVTERRTVTRHELRRALLPGTIFGLNITLFFTGVTRTTVANAEFIGSLTPIILIPAGALLFHEKVNLRALSFGLVSLAGLAIVLFNAPSSGEASWTGNLLIVGAVVLWAGYLMTSRKLREDMSVQAIMAAIMPIASLAVLPIAVVRGELDDVTVASLPYIVVLAVLTGTIAHGFTVFAQRTVPIGTIGLLQVAQPALAVVWAYLLLGQTILPVQLAGMGLVMIGQIAVVTATHRAGQTTRREAIEAEHG